MKAFKSVPCMDPVKKETETPPLLAGPSPGAAPLTEAGLLLAGRGDKGFCKQGGLGFRVWGLGLVQLRVRVP